MNDLDYQALWNMCVLEAKEEAAACYPYECKEKELFLEREIARRYKQRVDP